MTLVLLGGIIVTHPAALGAKGGPLCCHSLPAFMCTHSQLPHSVCNQERPWRCKAAAQTCSIEPPPYSCTISELYCCATQVSVPSVHCRSCAFKSTTMLCRCVCVWEGSCLMTCDNWDDCAPQAQGSGPLATQLADEACQPNCSGSNTFTPYISVAIILLGHDMIGASQLATGGVVLLHFSNFV